MNAAFREGAALVMSPAEQTVVPPIIYMDVDPVADFSALRRALHGVEQCIIYVSGQPHLHARPTRFEGLLPELIHAIATELGTAAGRAAMAATCRSWRDATARSDALWRTIALKRYPRLAGLARALAGREGGGASWMELYKAQVRAECPPLPARPLTLNSFVLSLEMYAPPPAASGGASAVQFTWTGTLSDVSEGECYPFADIPPPAWAPGAHVDCDDDEAVSSWWSVHRLHIEGLHMCAHLSRGDVPAEVRSVQLCDLPFGAFDAGELVWEGKLAYREGLHHLLHDDSLDGVSSAPARWLFGIELRFDPFEGKLEWGLRDRHLDRLGKAQLLHYALDAVPWN